MRWFPAALSSAILAGANGGLVGEFLHERIPGDRVMQNIMPGNQNPIESLDSAGRRRHWILEIHLVDRMRQIGGSYEELLTVG
jgi:Xaa-Pro dipeptidase